MKDFSLTRAPGHHIKTPRNVARLVYLIFFSNLSYISLTAMCLLCSLTMASSLNLSDLSSLSCRHILCNFAEDILWTCPGSPQIYVLFLDLRDCRLCFGFLWGSLLIASSSLVVCCGRHSVPLLEWILTPGLEPVVLLLFLLASSLLPWSILFLFSPLFGILSMFWSDKSGHPAKSSYQGKGLNWSRRCLKYSYCWPGTPMFT